MRRFTATGIASALAVTFLLIHFLTGVDFINLTGRLLSDIAWNHLDELLAAVLTVLAGIGIDGVAARKRKDRETEIQGHRLMVFRATMRSVHELVNDVLQQMQVFRMEAEGLMPEETLKSFDDLIHRTADELQALGNLESTPEIDTPFGRSIDHKGIRERAAGAAA